MLSSFQVQKTLKEIGQKVAKSIEDNYGKDESYTSVWNSTMTEVRHQTSYLAVSDITIIPTLVCKPQPMHVFFFLAEMLWI